MIKIVFWVFKNRKNSHYNVDFQTDPRYLPKKAFSERDKADRFERLMQGYLLTDPKYASRFKKVWLWSEFPAKRDIGGKDTGIDLVVPTHEGDYWAIQINCLQKHPVLMLLR